MDVNDLAFRVYTVHMHHTGKGLSRPGITIYRNWAGPRYLRHYRRPSKVMVQRLWRLLIRAYRAGRCTWEPGYPISVFTYTHYNPRNKQRIQELNDARSTK